MVNLNIPAVISRKCGFNCLSLCIVEGLSRCCLSNSKYLSQGIWLLIIQTLSEFSYFAPNFILHPLFGLVINKLCFLCFRFTTKLSRKYSSHLPPPNCPSHGLPYCQYFTPQWCICEWLTNIHGHIFSTQSPLP